MRETYLSVESSHVCVGNNLRHHRSQAQDAEHCITVAVEVEMVAKRNRQCGSFLRGGHSKELADLESGLAFCTIISEDGVVGYRQDLGDGVCEQQAVRSLVGQRVRIFGVILRHRR